MYAAQLEKHYMSGTWYGQSASGTIYILATVLERVDNDLLWYVASDVLTVNKFNLNVGLLSSDSPTNTPPLEYLGMNTISFTTSTMTKSPA